MRLRPNEFLILDGTLGYVGPRTTATDTDGNQLKQTVLRAYRLR
ncbi:hypothetical protein PV371_38630 [Streptomyces sp. TX20-6-3]|nr:hypothetical protein [Streptomyces sp. TX20-6-3]MDX2565435.1 hypothetical protein [Streptomyces sp. TX20-6-3]